MISGCEDGRRLATLFAQARQLVQVASKHRLRPSAVLEAFKVCVQIAQTLFRQRVDHPVLVARCSDDSSAAHVTQVLGDFDLWLAENVLEMTDAERTFGQQMQDAQPRRITEALVNFGQLQSGLTICLNGNIWQGEL